MFSQKEKFWNYLLLLLYYYLLLLVQCIFIFSLFVSGFEYKFIYYLLQSSRLNMNLLTLSQLVHDKQSSVLFLQQHGILHNSRLCSNNHPMLLKLGDAQDRWRCRRRDGHEEFPVRDSTWLKGSKLSYRKIILLV